MHAHTVAGLQCNQGRALLMTYLPHTIIDTSQKCTHGINSARGWGGLGEEGGRAEMIAECGTFIDGIII